MTALEQTNGQTDGLHALQDVIALACASGLTEREREVLALRLEGLTLLQVAGALGMSGHARPRQLEASAVAKMRARALAEINGRSVAL